MAAATHDGIDTISARMETLSGAITLTMEVTLSSGNPYAGTAVTTSAM